MASFAYLTLWRRFPSIIVSVEVVTVWQPELSPGPGLREAAQHNSNTPHFHNETGSKTPSISPQPYMTFCSFTHTLARNIPCTTTARTYPFSLHGYEIVLMVKIFLITHLADLFIQFSEYSEYSSGRNCRKSFRKGCFWIIRGFL